MNCTKKTEEDFATEWEKDLTTDERVALLAKTFDNKVESDDEEEEYYETGECEDCGDIHELTKFEKYDDKLYCGFCYEELEKEEDE